MRHTVVQQADELWYLLPLSRLISGDQSGGIKSQYSSFFVFLRRPFTRNKRNVCCKPVATYVVVPGGSNADVRYMDNRTKERPFGVPTKLRPADLGRFRQSDGSPSEAPGEPWRLNAHPPHAPIEPPIQSHPPYTPHHPHALPSTHCHTPSPPWRILPPVPLPDSTRSRLDCPDYITTHALIGPVPREPLTPEFRLLVLQRQVQRSSVHQPSATGAETTASAFTPCFHSYMESLDLC